MFDGSFIAIIMALIVGLVIGGHVMSNSYKEEAIEKGYAHRVIDEDRKGTHFEWLPVSTNVLTTVAE